MNTSALDGVADTELPTTAGPADYALFISGKWLAVIETKKVGAWPQNVLEQARGISTADRSLDIVITSGPRFRAITVTLRQSPAPGTRLR